jgi:hypothetical protein
MREKGANAAIRKVGIRLELNISFSRFSSVHDASKVEVVCQALMRLLVVNVNEVAEEVQQVQVMMWFFVIDDEWWKNERKKKDTLWRACLNTIVVVS